MARCRRHGSAVALAVGLYWRSQSKLKLTERDTIVLGDFDNKTGDPVFDGTLRQGLSAQLEQSPFLNLLSDQRIAQTLSLVTQRKAVGLSPEVAREICQRTASSAVLNGTIAQIRLPGFGRGAVSRLLQSAIGSIHGSVFFIVCWQEVNRRIGQPMR
jgi:hypothetical protein